MTDPGSSPSFNSASRPRRLTASAPPHHSPSSSSSSSPQSRPPQFLSYMHRPPRIAPNYGRRSQGASVLKSSVSRVLLYDNITQQQMLHVKIRHLGAEQRKTGRLMDMHRKSFITRRQQKEKQMAETALHVDHDLLEQGLLSAQIPRSVDNSKERTKQSPNPYIYIDDDSGDYPDSHYVAEHHTTSPLTNREDSEAQWAETRESPLQMLSVDRQRAVTSDALNVPTSHPARSSRTAHTAGMHRETMVKGQGTTLPNIHTTSDQFPLHVTNKTLIDSQQQNGVTRILHTFPQDHHPHHSHLNAWVQGGGKRRDLTTLGSGPGGKMMQDDRYRMLEKLLVRIEPPNEGYLELSPSFHNPRQTVTYTRPPSFHPSVYRRRASSSASSALTGTFSVQIQDL